MLVLLRGGKVPAQQWVLIVTSTILIILATIHVGASLQQLLDAFVYTPRDVPDYSVTCWLDFDTTPGALKNNLYDTLVFVQDFIIIWRLYVVFLYDWRVVVFPIILVAASMGVCYAASPMVSDVGPRGSVVPSLIMSAGVLDATLNVSVTMAIAVRLWWRGRTTASLTSTRTNRFAFSIYVAVESGVIFAGANMIALVLYALNNPAWSAGFTVASQVATLTPLLIVVQVGLAGQHRFLRGNYLRTMPTPQDQITVQVGNPQDSLQDISLHATLSRLPSFANSARVV
ncbi:hypothetical protein HD554DRAFT_863024 [Boletus coccyginus]|nr:hypothetical protein HD554DRAFT_863024 [Boletus coccyginus]